MRPTVLLLLLVVVVAAGCAGRGGGARFDAADGPRLVLQDADVGDTYGLFDRGRQGRADVFGHDTVDPARHGRIGGWKSRYRRLNGSRAPGVVVIESKVDVFSDTDGAKQDFKEVRDAVKRDYLVDDRHLRPLELGDETITATAGQGSGEFATRFYVVAWRDGNAHAWVLVNGLEPLAFSDVARLARAQAARLNAAR